MKMQMKLLLTVFSLFCLFSISAENLVRRPEPGKNPVWRLTTWIKKPGTFLVQDENLILRNADRTETAMAEQSIRLKAHANYDLFMNMPYYQGARWYDDLQFNQTSLKTPNYPLIDPTENMEMFYTRESVSGRETTSTDAICTPLRTASGPLPTGKPVISGSAVTLP